MTESTPSEPSMPEDSAPRETPEPASTGTSRGATGESGEAETSQGSGEAETSQGSGQAAEGRAEPDGTAASPPGRRRLVLVLAAVAVAALLVVAAVVFVVRQPRPTQVGDCIQETNVVSCEEPHELRIVQIVGNPNDCAPPATHAMKEPDGRYLCVVEEAS